MVEAAGAYPPRARSAHPLRLALGVVLAGAVLFPASALATPTWSASCSGDLDVATCERLTYIATAQDDLRTLCAWGCGLLLFLIVVPLMNRTFRV